MRVDADVRAHPVVEDLAASRLEQALLAGVAVVLALVVFGWALVPAAVPLAPAAVLVGYGVLARFGARTLQRSDPRALRVTAICGVLAAVVFVPSLLIEYVGKTVNNGVMFGTVFGLWFLAGVLTARLTGRIRDAALSSTLSAMISSLAFVTALLASYYLLRGSALQDRFFRTEGDYEDFARSGMKDFNAWVIEDMFGGTFFHLLLGALIAAALGSVAGILTVAVVRLRARRGSADLRSG